MTLGNFTVFVHFCKFDRWICWSRRRPNFLQTIKDACVSKNAGVKESFLEINASCAVCYICFEFSPDWKITNISEGQFCYASDEGIWIHWAKIFESINNGRRYETAIKLKNEQKYILRVYIMWNVYSKPRYQMQNCFQVANK